MLFTVKLFTGVTALTQKDPGEKKFDLNFETLQFFSYTNVTQLASSWDVYE